MIKKLDRWCNDLWLVCLGALGVTVAILLVLNWNTWTPGAKGGAFLAVIMPLHVLEEWKFPGGLHYIYNIIFGPKEFGSRYLDRYPMSRFTDMITNVGLAVIPLLYAIPAQLCGRSNMVAICIIILSFGEVLAHTVVGGYSLKRYRKAGKTFIYCPGLFTAYTLFLPAGIYLCAQLSHVTVEDVIGGVAAMAVLGIVCVPLQEMPLKKWVLRQGDELFAFADPKYYAKFVDKDHC